jgi:hypothetical protein
MTQRCEPLSGSLSLADGVMSRGAAWRTGVGQAITLPMPLQQFQV